MPRPVSFCHHSRVFLTRLMALAALLSLGACSSLEITRHKTEATTDLTSMKTYRWADGEAFDSVEPTGGHNRSYDAVIRDAANQVLQQKGYEETTGNADFTVDYRIVIKEDVVATDSAYSASQNDEDVNQFGPTWQMGGGDAGYQGLATPEEELIFLQRGTLHIGAFNDNNELVWHSSAEKMLNSQNSDAQRRESIHKAVTRISETFPNKQ